MVAIIEFSLYNWRCATELLKSSLICAADLVNNNLQKHFDHDSILELPRVFIEMRE